jgi:tRNA1(Val) A37 N6-methylase TrmN6
MAEAAEEVSEDTLLDGRVRLKQLTRGHRAGTDAVLLAAAAIPRPATPSPTSARRREPSG